MNPGAVLRSGANPQRDSGGPAARGRRRGGDRGAAASVALWLFILVASTLFALFFTAYIMRMSEADWHPIALPWQLWLSTALLVIGSAFLHFSSASARLTRWAQAQALLLAGGMCALAFLASQWWGWQALQAVHVMPSGNPAAGFYYMLTAMHGLHVAGGLIAWGVTARSARRDLAGFSWRVALCARYWHFLLLVWLALFAVLAWLTPEVARLICGVR
jgi:cytochrome c oxidase subunit 3